MKNTLFRYSSPSSKFFLNELTKRELYFSHPSDFNDPFDCQMEYKRALEEALEQANLKEYFSSKKLSELLEHTLNNVGVCCFSRAKKNQLMWSHYAEKHTGICLGFNREVLRRDLSINLIKNVVYQASHPLDTMIGQFQILAMGDVPDIKTLLNTFIYPLLITKYSYWKYERETRFITKNYGTQSISNKAIQSLTLGLKISNDIKGKVFRLLQQPDWSHVKVYQAKKAQSRFALDFDRLSQSGELICQ